MAFFLLNGLKIYYLSFLTIPLVIILTAKLKSRLGTAITVFLIFYSVLYSYGNFSLTTREFLADSGWKKLQEELSKNYTQKSCLIIDPNDHPLQQRRYLGINDKIKEYYLGSSYTPKYQQCWQKLEATDKWIIKTTDKKVTFERKYL